jgi:exodeoxyribonuclease-5
MMTEKRDTKTLEELINDLNRPVGTKKEKASIVTPVGNIVLSADQQTAFDEIMASVGGRAFFCGKTHVLEGVAGSGKSTLCKLLVKEMKRRKLEVVATAPTNKAVAVLERMMQEADIEVDCGTIYSLLGLAPGNEDEKRAPRRINKGWYQLYDVVIIDECSMLSGAIMGFIEKDLKDKNVLFIGDPYQLPPVGEARSRSFSCENRSSMTKVMRQAADNPVIRLSSRIRTMVDKQRASWGGFFEDTVGSQGVFYPGDARQEWIEDAFASREFAADNDRCRYLCWTNNRVDWVNRMIREMVYGITDTPFIEGERVLVRAPILMASGSKGMTVAIQTNDEAIVREIEPYKMTRTFDRLKSEPTRSGKILQEVPERTFDIMTWKLKLENRRGLVVTTYIPADKRAFADIKDVLVSDGRLNSKRWYQYFSMIDEIINVQSVYAMTVHCSQGSTFDNVFVDLDDIMKNRNQKEMLQLLYVACTRPRNALVVV